MARGSLHGLTKKQAVIAVSVSVLLVALYVPIVPFGFWMMPPTGSMNPTIRGCDVLLYGPGEPEEDAIMMFWYEDHSMYIHRIIEKRENGYLFQGDNRDEPDGVIPEDDIQAKVYTWFSTPISHEMCVAFFEPVYNSYYMLLGSDTRYAHVDD